MRGISGVIVDGDVCIRESAAGLYSQSYINTTSGCGDSLSSANDGRLGVHIIHCCAGDGYREHVVMRYAVTAES